MTKELENVLDSNKFPSARAALKKFMDELRPILEETNGGLPYNIDFLEGIAAHAFSIGYNEAAIDIIDGNHSLFGAIIDDGMDDQIKVSTHG